jgi:hypothetical protein
MQADERYTQSLESMQESLLVAQSAAAGKLEKRIAAALAKAREDLEQDSRALAADAEEKHRCVSM